MEEKVFHRSAVAGELDRFVEARLHTDGSKNIDEIKQLQSDLTGSIALPFYVAIDPQDEKELGSFEGATVFDDAPFVDFLVKSREKTGERYAQLGD